MLSLAFSILALTACDPSGATDNEGKVDTSSNDICQTDPSACDEDGDGFRPSEGDCDDGNADVFPGATEVCDGIDQNCDDAIDEGVTNTFYQDFDVDGFGNPEVTVQACEAPEGYIPSGTDCNDAEASAFPGGVEVCDGIDNDCNTVVDDGVTTRYYSDADGDGFGDPALYSDECAQPTGTVLDNTDCDDSSRRSFPGNEEVCDEIDNDCDSVVDEGVTTTYYADVDGDRYGDPAITLEACATPTGYIDNALDCDDSRTAVNPAAVEACNTYDDDCDGTVDEPDAVDAVSWYADVDTDTFGDPAVSERACTQPSGYVADATDCDDARALTNPAATEYCNTYDDNCNGTVDEDTAADAVTWYQDRDLDTFGNASVSVVQCSAPSGYVVDNTDCLDTSAISYPGAPEICDELDNDCNGTVDDGPTDGITYYADADADSFGDPDVTVSECELPPGYSENWYDCDDSDSGEPRVADVTLGSPSGTGSVSAPYDSIQDAIDAADACVIVYAGTYGEVLDLGGKNVDVWGVDGADTTIIDANLPTCTSSNPTACGSVVTVASGSNATPALHGFTLTGGSGAVTSSSTTTTCADSSSSHSGRNTCTVTTYEYCGGGLYVNGDDPTVYDVVIRDNTLPSFEQATVGSFTQYWLYSYGGGVCLRDSNADIYAAMIEGNYADQGGGVFAEDGSSFSVDQSTVSENSAADGGGFNLSGASASITNVAVGCNAASTDGGGLYTESSGTATFTNTSFYRNTSSTSGTARGAAAYVGSSTTFNLLNSIVEAATSVYALYGAGGSGTHDYNNVYNTPGSAYGGTLAAGTAVISSGSNFTSVGCDGNPYNDNFALRGTSASVNAGNPTAAFNDADGSLNDLGAFGGPGGSW